MTANEKFIFLKNYNFIKFVIYLMPFVPIISFIDGNKEEHHFDISLLLFYLIVYTTCTALVWLFTRKHPWQQKALFCLSSFFTVFVSYHYISLPFGTFSPNTGFTLTVIAQLFIAIGLAMCAIKASKFLMIIILSFLIVPVVSLALNGGNLRWDLSERWVSLSYILTDTPKTADQKLSPKPVIDSTIKPNILIFLFDGYQRSDILKDYYGYDNAPFLRELGQLGFNTFNNSQSNFPKTTQSLNFILSRFSVNERIENIAAQMQQKHYLFRSENETPEMLQLFEQHGYTLWTQNYLGRRHKDCGIYCFQVSAKLLYEETQYLKMTPLYAGLKLFYPGHYLGLVKSLNNDNFQSYRQYVRQNKSALNANLFISHAIIPHPPYILTSLCELKADNLNFDLNELVYDDMNTDYLEQISCSNKQMLSIAAEIIANDSQAIIIFASDHGWKYSHAIAERVSQAGLTGDQLSNLFRYTNFISVRAPKSCFMNTREVYFLGDVFPDIVDCLSINVEKPLLKNFGSFRFNQDNGKFSPVDVNALLKAANKP